MKNIFTFLIITSFLITACNENSTQTTSGNEITGTWLLKQTSGGFGGGTTYPPENQRNLVTVTEGNLYTESRNDTVIFSSTFSIYVDSMYNKKIIDFIDSRRFSLVIQHVSSDSLILWDGFMDGFSFFYTRVK